jgi:hypothetical protein
MPSATENYFYAHNFVLFFVLTQRDGERRVGRGAV